MMWLLPSVRFCAASSRKNRWPSQPNAHAVLRRKDTRASLEFQTTGVICDTFFFVTSSFCDTFPRGGNDASRHELHVNLLFF